MEGEVCCKRRGLLLLVLVLVVVLLVVLLVSSDAPVFFLASVHEIYSWSVTHTEFY